MVKETKKNNNQSTPGGTLTGTSYEAEDVFENAEPWSPVETQIVVGSLVVALVLLVIFSYFIDLFILSGH
jgi:hypothetical protein